MESVHKNFRNHKCDICDKEFNGQTAYLKHIDQVHKNKRIHKCDCCVTVVIKVSLNMQTT